MAGGARKSKETKPTSEGKEDEDVDVGRVADSPLHDESKLFPATHIASCVFLHTHTAPGQPLKRGTKRTSDTGVPGVENAVM